MTAYRYRLIDGSGNDLGLFVSGSGDWQPGRLILREAGDFEVRAVVEAEAGETFGAYLVVERADLGR